MLAPGPRLAVPAGPFLRRLPSPRPHSQRKLHMGRVPADDTPAGLGLPALNLGQTQPGSERRWGGCWERSSPLASLLFLETQGNQPEPRPQLLHLARPLLGAWVSLGPASAQPDPRAFPFQPVPLAHRGLTRWPPPTTIHTIHGPLPQPPPAPSGPPTASPHPQSLGPAPLWRELPPRRGIA